MSADVLREAASLMRERAEAATPGPWVATWAGGVTGPERHVASAHNASDVNAKHIASWHPAVALAVADWLEQHADYAQSLGRESGPNPLAVARAYLRAA